MELFRIDPAEVAAKLTEFLSISLGKTGLKKYVIGMSGGLDSSVCAVLAIRAVGAQNALGLMMPYASSSANSSKDAIKLASELGMELANVSISPMVDSYAKDEKDMSTIRKGNFMARTRMAVLYDYAAKHQGLVLGTSNKTEALLGYGTIHGDAAWDVNPLWDLYKTHVRTLAQYLKISPNIIEKIPTADLWEGQTDEGELGFTYERIDRLLYLMIDRKFELERLVGEGFEESEILRARTLIKRNQFKRSGPAVARLFEHYEGCGFIAPDEW